MNSKTLFRYLQLALCIAACSLTGCIHEPLARPEVATVFANTPQKGDEGFYFGPINKARLVAKGVPEAWFVKTPRGYYLTKDQEDQAAVIREKIRNP